MTKPKHGAISAFSSWPQVKMPFLTNTLQLSIKDSVTIPHNVVCTTIGATVHTTHGTLKLTCSTFQVGWVGPGISPCLVLLSGQRSNVAVATHSTQVAH